MTETIVDETDEEVRDFIIKQCGLAGLPPGARVIGFRDKDGIRGAFCFERYTGVKGSIHAHWAGRDKNWLKGYMLTLAFMYAFDQLGCSRIYGEVRGKASGTRKIDEKIGFKEIYRFEGYFPEDELIIYELLKNDCMWLPSEFKEAS